MRSATVVGIAESLHQGCTVVQTCPRTSLREMLEAALALCDDLQGALEEQLGDVESRPGFPIESRSLAPDDGGGSSAFEFLEPDTRAGRRKRRSESGNRRGRSSLGVVPQ